MELFAIAWLIVAGGLLGLFATGVGFCAGYALARSRYIALWHQEERVESLEDWAQQMGPPFPHHFEPPERPPTSTPESYAGDVR